MAMRRFSLIKKKIHDDDSLEAIRLLDEQTPFAIREAYLKLCTNIMYLPNEKRCKTIAVTSAIPGEGKTLASINIAIGLSEYIDKSKVLLIDSDLRRSRIQRLLGDMDNNCHGLSEYLAGIDDEVNIIKSSVNEKIDVIYAGASTPNPAGLLSSSRLGALIQQLEEKYTYIIIDTPPVNIVTDALLYASYVSGYIISVRADYSNVNLVNETIRNITDVNGKVFGTVLNSFNPKYERRGNYYSAKSYSE